MTYEERARPTRRPDKSHRASAAHERDLSTVAAQLAVQDDELRMRAAARLGVAAAGLARELAAARREIAVLKRENRALRSSLDGGARDNGHADT
jgi:hypothetical protein